MTSHGKRILILAADERALIDLQRSLEDEEFVTNTTWDPAEALKLARSHKFDVLLVGDHPPEVSGAEMLRDLQCDRINVPCVVLETGRQAFDPDFLYSLGAAGVILNCQPANVIAWLQERFATGRAAAVASR